MTARAFFQAFDSADLDAMVSLMHPDIVWEVPGRSPVAGRFEGLAAVGGMMLEINAMSGDTVKTQMRELFVNDNGVVALITVDAAPPGDEPWRGEDAWLVRTDGSQITEVREHWFDTTGFDELKAWESRPRHGQPAPEMP